MLIPSIDLMGGKIVQLVQGRTKALEFDNAEAWIARFSGFPLVQLIDLDAATGNGSNTDLKNLILSRLPCQIGGGIRSIATAQAVLESGATRVILGSVLVREGKVNISEAHDFAHALGTDKLVFAIDTRDNKIAINGWKQGTDLTPAQMVQELEPFCAAFLYTHIDTEGSMKGIPLDPVRRLRAATSKHLIVAGGISTQEEIATLHSIGIDAVVGMALYTNLLQVPYTIPASQ